MHSMRQVLQIPLCTHTPGDKRSGRVTFDRRVFLECMESCTWSPTISTYVGTYVSAYMVWSGRNVGIVCVGVSCTWP